MNVIDGRKLTIAIKKFAVIFLLLSFGIIIIIAAIAVGCFIILVIDLVDDFCQPLKLCFIIELVLSFWIYA